MPNCHPEFSLYLITREWYRYRYTYLKILTYLNEDPNEWVDPLVHRGTQILIKILINYTIYIDCIDFNKFKAFFFSYFGVWGMVDVP